MDATSCRLPVRRRVNSIQFGWLSVTYDGSSHGTFIQSTGGNVGDITG